MYNHIIMINKVTFFTIVSCVELILGNFTVFEQANFIQSVAEHFGCNSIILATGPSDSIYRKIFLDKYLHDRVRFYVGVWNFEAFTRNIYSDEPWIPPKSLVVVEYNLVNIQELIKISSKIDLSSFDWLIISTLPRINDFLYSNIKIPINCRFLISTTSTNKIFNIYEAYQISRNSEIIIKHFGDWKSDNGLYVLERGDMFNSRMNLKRHEFRLAVHNISNNINPCTSPKVDNAKDVIHCAHYNIWHSLERLFNFSTTYITTDDCYQNGTTGLSTPTLEAIRIGEVDSAPDGYIWSPARLQHHQFFWPIFDSKVILLTKIPPRKFSFSSYVRPFVTKLWFALIAWLIFSGLVINLSKYISKKIIHQNRQLHNNNNNNVTDNFFIPFTAIFYQGSSDVPVEAATRLVYLMVYLIPVVFIPSYSGSITSTLSVPTENLPFTSLQEFEANGNYLLNAVNNTFFFFYLMTDEKFENVRQKHLIPKRLTVSYEQAVVDICTRRETFIFEWPILTRYAISCNVFKFDLGATKVFSSMAVRKHFPYLELFNREIQKLVTSGIGKTILLKVITYNFEYEIRPLAQNYLQLKPFSCEDVLPVFAVLGVGLLLSIITLLIERHNELFLTHFRNYLASRNFFLRRGTRN